MDQVAITQRNPYGFDADQQRIFDAADEFARRELYPLSTRMDAEEWWPPEAFAKIAAAGFFGMTVAEEDGGLGLDMVSAGAVVQAFGRWNHALALSYVVHDNIDCWLVVLYGSLAILGHAYAVHVSVAHCKLRHVIASNSCEVVVQHRHRLVAHPSHYIYWVSTLVFPVPIVCLIPAIESNTELIDGTRSVPKAAIVRRFILTVASLRLK